MTPEQALALAKAIADIYAQGTVDIVTLISRTTAKGMGRPDWAERRLADTLTLRRNALRIVEAMQAHGTAEVLRVLEEAYRGGRLPHAAAAGGGLTAVDQRAVAVLAADTVGALDGMRPRILRWTDDIYRRVVADTVSSTVTGTLTRPDAAARAVERFTAAGVNVFVDGAGRRWGVDTYAEMAVRTATGHAHLEGTLERYREEGRGWVVVSDSPDECSLCRPFEGTVLSLGADGPPPDLPAGMRYRGTHAAARRAGLHHPNCTHRVHAYVPGLTKPMTRVKENRQGYEDRQRQRLLERRVRESKQRVEALKPFGDTAELRRQRALLAARRAALAEHIEATGRKAWVSQRRVNTRSR